VITEIQKRSVLHSHRPSYLTSVPLEAWVAHTQPEFPGGNFLEWIVESKVIMAQDCSMLAMLGWGVMNIFQEAWQTDYYDPHIFDRRTPAWLKMGDYRLYLAQDGNSLTVQRGQQYGHFIDVQNFEGDWPRLAQGLKALGVDHAPYPASQGRVAAGLLQEFARPLKADTPLRVLDLAWQACKGSRMEALTLGTFEGVAYDISSAFPFAAGQLPWAKCRWKEASEFHSDAHYGFAQIEANIPQDLIAGPLAVRVGRDDETALHFPVGKVRITASQPEMRLLKDMGIPFVVKRGWWGYPSQDIYPFARLMEMLWELREYDKAGGKALSVACVGQLGSVIDDGGKQYQARPFYNPIYSAHIYADTRCRVYRKALEVGLENVMAFTIDGIISVREGRVDSVGFGAWRLESQGSYFLANDYFKDRPGEAPRWREAVANTHQDVPESRFQVVLDNYVGITAVMERPGLQSKLGGFIEVVEDLPLGSDRRKMPVGVGRKDFLAGKIETRL